MASASSDGNVIVWDLLKLVKVDSFKLSSNDSEDNVTHVAKTLSFCPLGKYLAVGTANGRVYICVVKDMTQSVSLAASSDNEGALNGILWGVNAQAMILCNDHDRGVQFWGIQAKDP